MAPYIGGTYPNWQSITPTPGVGYAMATPGYAAGNGLLYTQMGGYGAAPSAVPITNFSNSVNFNGMGSAAASQASPFGGIGLGQVALANQAATQPKNGRHRRWCTGHGCQCFVPHH
jgi:hypothetical protein